MTVSIIIAVKTWQRHLEECVAKCLQLDYPDFEIIILPDEIETVPAGGRGTCPSERARCLSIIPTGPVGPSEKRDKAVDYAQGEILAFIDDDAYPHTGWLKHAVKIFEDPQVAAVGGPAITPENDNLRQKASGLVFASVLVSGDFIYRYLARKRREVDDYPTCNFLVRKTVMRQLGGFNTKFWPGEDTKLCLEITDFLKKKIIYDPKVLVYHHRREVFRGHLKQVSSYALHRGYFVKRYPKTSRRAAYFIPSIFVAGIILGGFFSLFLPAVRWLYLPGLLLYLLLVFIFSLKKDLRLTPLIFFSIIATHTSYGIYFLKGLFSIKLKEE
ncbi:MAG: glycosyltransferase [Candidatus Omnitrophica bacterium]|nr:glycosyltransferase [Candidatus Omnitrophota bacterium]